MPNPAQLNPVNRAQINLPAFDAHVELTGAALLVVLAVAIHLAAMSPGNWPADIALMTAFS